MLHVDHPILAGVCKAGGDSLGHPTRQVGDFSIAESRILEVTDVELEHLFHASEQCMTKREMMSW